MPPRTLFGHTYDAERYDISRTRCCIAHADFRKAPEAVPSFTYAVVSGTGQVRYRVTSDTALALTAVRFPCVQSESVRGMFLTKPVFQKALSFELKPGGAVELISERMFTTVEGCAIYSVDAL